MNELSATVLEERTRLLTVPEVAEWLGLNPQTLYYWRHTGRGPRSLTVGSSVRYRPGDVEEWLEQGAKRGMPS
jgi:excisionase family DNA binding protein